MMSAAQRRLMYSAASKKGGAAGVSQTVAKEFVASDKPGKLPEHVSPKNKKSRRSAALYGNAD